MENNFIQMADLAGHAVAYTIGPIFKHIIDSLIASRILSFKASIVSGVTLIFDVQRCQIAAPRWPNDISSAADNAIVKNRVQNIECSFSWVARGAVLVKSNVANILLFKFCEQNFVQHGPKTIAIDCNGLCLLIFEEKFLNYASGPKSAPNVLGASPF